ncbi:hypothetical protein FOXG_20177 [Fusarium oxysporum f. sp. lycopersici 4287]|uniref:Uncharacterized protein n=2 Tax=Fusarium oxysporum TaxID=5507 RepID=A0A0J9VE10_FUSO4|nr:hypothetical protein FOXG_20177 [Fusarium oxysporum f. sp. lycopersici 4287]EXK28416.1 hypothetical protein FOMG_15395 [Fusarium oxysporum f. sp. melonis 26406]KNB09283.1 hypothetical protein FOXG_20177 [Fusarium oxysporum f. sp. lycopersici 4287]
MRLAPIISTYIRRSVGGQICMHVEAEAVGWASSASGLHPCIAIFG